MATEGPNSGGTFADDATVGTVAWSNTSDAGSSNDVYASCVIGMPGQAGHYLKITNFGLSILAGSTITGITVIVECKGGANLSDNSVKIVQGGTISGDEKASATTWSVSDANRTYGSSSTLWGLTWTADDINASTFGVAISPLASSGATASIDHVTITIDYSLPATAVLTGTAIETDAIKLRESHVVAGGKTIIITLANKEWVAAGATFDAQRQNIINGFDSAQAEAGGWDAKVKALEVVTAIVRTSSTVVTWTLTASAAFDITATETITATLPSSAFTVAGVVVATPTFRVVPDIPRMQHLGGLGIGGEIPARPMVGQPRAGQLPAGMGGMLRRY